MDKDKANEAGSSGSEQKSDKSPQELMQQVSQADDSLNAGPKKSAVDEMAEATTTETKEGTEIKKKPVGPGFIKRIISLLNIYALIFVLLLVASGGIFAYSYFKNQAALNPDLETASLTQETLDELKSSDAVIGDPRQILTIESHAIISGKVVLRDTLDVAGALNVGGALSLPSVSASGEGSFGSLRTNDLQSAGNAAIGGLLDVTDNLSVGRDLLVTGKIVGGNDFELAGNAVISGNLNVKGLFSADNLSFSSVSFDKINSLGSTPGASPGGAAGGAATASVSGTDTAGTVTINTGGGTGTGILATVAFTSPYTSANPHVVIAPNGAGCAAVNYYVTNISAGGFAIATASTAPAASTCRFNYIVIN